MRLHRVVMSVAATCVAMAPIGIAHGQGPADISGTWALDASVSLPDELIPCVYEGSAVVSQTADTVTGPTDLALVSGSSSCPAEMAGTLSGKVSLGKIGETVVNGVIDGGALGQAAFTGSFTTVVAPVAAAGFMATAIVMQGPSSGVGSIGVTAGPFTGASGTWAAAVAPAVPTLGPLVLTILVALLLAAGFLILRRQQAPRPI
jgi:hypothetical protein